MVLLYQAFILFQNEIKNIKHHTQKCVSPYVIKQVLGSDRLFYCVSDSRRHIGQIYILY